MTRTSRVVGYDRQEATDKTRSCIGRRSDPAAGSENRRNGAAHRTGGPPAASTETRRRVASAGGRAPHGARGLQAADDETRKRVAQAGGRSPPHVERGTGGGPEERGAVRATAPGAAVRSPPRSDPPRRFTCSREKGSSASISRTCGFQAGDCRGGFAVAGGVRAYAAPAAFRSDG